MATGILLGFLVGRRGWATRLPELGATVRRARIVAATIVAVSASSSTAGGLGFWGRPGPARETALAVALFVAVQLPVSVWWLGRFRYGPVEYLWRLVTYGRGAL